MIRMKNRYLIINQRPRKTSRNLRKPKAVWSIIALNEGPTKLYDTTADSPAPVRVYSQWPLAQSVTNNNGDEVKSELCTDILAFTLWRKKTLTIRSFEGCTTSHCLKWDLLVANEYIDHTACQEEDEGAKYFLKFVCSFMELWAATRKLYARMAVSPSPVWVYSQGPVLSSHSTVCCACFVVLLLTSNFLPIWVRHVFNFKMSLHCLVFIDYKDVIFTYSMV